MYIIWISFIYEVFEIQLNQSEYIYKWLLALITNWV